MRSEPQSESGAVLLLALIFLFAIALILAGLVTLANTNLGDTIGLQNNRSTGYAADGALETAIQDVRSMTTSGSVVGYSTSNTLCQPSGQTELLSDFSVNENQNTENIRVDCGLEASPAPFEREIMFAACGADLGQACLTDSNFSPTANSAAVIVAQVVFDDLGAGCSTDEGNCFQPGTTATVASWTVNLADG